MKIKILNDNGTINIHNTDKLTQNSTDNEIRFINSSSKEQNTIDIIKAYKSNKKTILFDNTNKILSKKLDELNLDIFKNKDFSMMFFTSGTTGNPLGALKTKENLEEEIKVFTQLIKQYDIKQVIVTVPFIHIYGTLLGLLFPLFNNIDIILKEHFLPNNLLEVIEENSLIVTTPLYIKSLNKITQNKDLKSSLFISSTAPLNSDDTKEFLNKFNTNIIQLFGSTETSGIAYKKDTQVLWTPLDKVNISVNSKNELKIKSPFVSNILFENNFINTKAEIQTFDYVEIEKNKFKLIGRSSKIFKIAGKRYSTIQIENILEEIYEIQKALVFVENNDDKLRDEILNITLESKKEFSSKEIKNILKEKISNL
ncbi:MAG: AMP-binding protein, partial [Campylobacterota bacterium]|nr:AMP-binding protein [Campylobacterota bacterium]